MPTGISSPLSLIVHMGTDIAGSHHIFADTVYISAKYILSGSDFSQNFQATSGEVGMIIISYDEYILLKSDFN
jgi:hypothetical protein